MTTTLSRPNPPRKVFSGRRGRLLREYLTGYLMIAPAVSLILLFGIFPVGFALYVSLHRWQLVQGPFRGLGNYINAMGNLTYVVLFVLGIGGLIGAFFALRSIRRQARQHQHRPWLLAIPGLAYATAITAWLRWVYLQLPEVLAIAMKIRGAERTRELFLTLLDEAFHMPTVFPAWQLFLQILAAAVIINITAVLLWRKRQTGFYIATFLLAWVGTAVGIALLWVMVTQINGVYETAVAAGEDPGTWPQVITILAGIILLVIGWRVWQSAQKQDSTTHFGFRLLAGLVLAVGAILLIFEIPSVIDQGNSDMWQGLKVTFFFSLGTVPVQLTIALFLSVLLFQKLKGSELFRIIFFLPYVTPAVASAAIFKALFSARAASPANNILGWMGIETQAWLSEPRGIIELIGDGLGLEIATWASGPSLALCVIILLSIWTYVGYNTVIYLAGLGNISIELTESAEIDGANKWQVFRHIIFPLLSPTTYFLSLLAIIGTFKAFNTIWVLRDGAALGTTDPFSVVIFNEFFTKTRYGYASALAFVLFAIILSLTLINNRVQGSRVFYG